ncbi:MULTISPECIES: hypothetical protein [unclassified Collinsella]|uniref:hypothetical protein n=1 Tax=unclassified Collinsella TaxID=2637548 RepID=UPI003F9328DC
MRMKRALLAVLCAVAALSVTLPTNVLADDSSSNGSEDDKYYYDKVVNTGLDNGYSESNSIKEGDPHFGWKLGRFVVSGFTSRAGDDVPVFLKNSGDRVELSFQLNQSIDSLNGDDKRKISGDGNGYDEYFGIPKTDFGHGALITKHTDYQNASTEPTVSTEYLSSVKVGANTHIDMYEEGDYEVALDYEIESPGLLPFRPAYNNYRIFFKFKVRNSNTMMFLFDTATNNELFNGSVTSSGFRIDMAGSHYLDVSVKREVLNSTGDGLTEDVRFNKTATDGAVFEDEGIYTVTVKNPNTGEEATTKRIYVGTNDAMKASVANNMTLAEAQERIAEGATVADDGSFRTASKKTDASANEVSGKNGDAASMGGPVIALLAVGLVLILAFIVIARCKKIAVAEVSSESGPAVPDTDLDGEEGGDE